jgi:hypothetical protein
MPPRSRSISPFSKTHAPVTQATGPERVRQPAWYFRRERGINCSQTLRTKLGNAPTEGCRDPSALRKPKPTIPGAPRAVCNCSTLFSTWPSRSTPGTTSGLSTSSQGLCDARQPAFTPAAKPPFSQLRISRTPGRGVMNSSGMGPSDALSTITRSHLSASTSGELASVSTSFVT